MSTTEGDSEALTSANRDYARSPGEPDTRRDET